VIGLLRFVGLLNAAVWLGVAAFFLFFAFGPAPALASTEMQELLSARNFPYFSVAIEQLLARRFLHWYLACSLVALLHLVAEWLYQGRYPQRMWLALVLALCLGGLVQTFVVQPQLKQLHRLHFPRPDLSEAAYRSFQAWHKVSTALELLLVGGLLVYLWRVANPPDSTRFLNAGKFRS
jgi:hypothetical protein